jgi:hypothetical protein
LRVFFLQIPRTGGTSLHRIIEQNYQPEEMFTVPTVPWEGGNFRGLRAEWSQEAKSNIKIVRGHMHHGWHYAFPNEPYCYITIMRDPVERVKSLWRYVWGHEGHPLYPHKQVSVRQFIYDTANGMTKMLSGMPNISGCGDLALEMAAAHLAQDFALVGFTENYEWFLRMLSRHFRWKCDMVHTNASDSTRTFGHEEMVRAYNGYDISLYRWARKHFQTRMEKYYEGNI